MAKTDESYMALTVMDNKMKIFKIHWNKWNLVASFFRRSCLWLNVYAAVFHTMKVNGDKSCQAVFSALNRKYMRVNYSNSCQVHFSVNFIYVGH